MTKFTVYTKENCSHCERVKQVLRNAQLEYEEKIVPFDADKEMIQALVDASGAVRDVRSVPQIFHGETYVGDSRELLLYLDKLQFG